jgi:hypothetical protein
MLTIVELPEYLRAAEKLLEEEERSAIVTTLARTPASGVLIVGTGRTGPLSALANCRKLT